MDQIFTDVHAGGERRHGQWTVRAVWHIPPCWTLSSWWLWVFWELLMGMSLLLWLRFCNKRNKDTRCNFCWVNLCKTVSWTEFLHSLLLCASDGGGCQKPDSFQPRAWVLNTYILFKKKALLKGKKMYFIEKWFSTVPWLPRVHHFAYTVMDLNTGSKNITSWSS